MNEIRYDIKLKLLQERIRLIEYHLVQLKADLHEMIELDHNESNAMEKIGNIDWRNL